MHASRAGNPIRGLALGSESRLCLHSDPHSVICSYRHSGFCYIDARDCAQAFRLAIEKPLIGAHVFNIANADIAFTQTTKELADLVFPDVKYTPETDNPREGLVSIKKAREMLGFDPKYDWQSELKKLESTKK